ncbi:hypothetical protein CRYUN_Cryun30bG0088100 [Craigia yunnanensis]
MPDLSRNNLTGSIPEDIFSLKKLSKLLLLVNPLSRGLLKSVANCQSLVRLRLGENQLSGNIVKLLGYCSNKSVKLLLYNYIPNGTLQQLLRGNRNLEWETRYKIAIGLAQSLAYLHQDCLPAILHRDVKCNNILLDSKYEAYLAYFGLAKLMNSLNYHHAMSKVAGSYGYIALGQHP